jgi:hypothetical protein
MILKKNTDYIEENLTEDAFDSIEAGISEDAFLAVFDMVSNSMYKNPIGSIVREITCNCCDSHTEAGVDTPVLVKASFDENGEYISFTDYGVGLSPERISKIYMNYFTSTKTKSNDYIGAFGLGSKSPLSYTSGFYINTIYNGIEYNYYFHRGVKKPTLEILEQKETKKRNGTEIKIYLIEPYQDKRSFTTNIREQLAYFDNIYYEGFLLTNFFKIYEGKYFKLRNNERPFNQMHIILGNVVYPIDFNELKIDCLNIPVGVKFEIGELPVIPSRESIRYLEETKTLILDRIEKVKEELKDLYKTHFKFNPDLFEWLKIINDKNKERFTYLNFDFIPDFNLSLDLSEIIGKIKLVFPKETEIGFNFPSNPFIFYDCYFHILNGKVFKQKHYSTDYLIKNKNCFLFTKQDTQNKLFNRYIYKGYLIVEKTVNYKYLLRYLGFSRYDLGVAYKIYKFKKYVQSEVNRVIPKYRDIVITESWLNLNKEIIVKTDYKTYRKENKIIPGYNIKTQKQSEFKLSNLDIKGLIFIYGYSEDKEELKIVEKLLRQKFSLKNKELKVDPLQIFRISKANKKYFETMNNTVYVKNFPSDNRIFKNIITAYYIKENLDKNYIEKIKFWTKINKNISEKLMEIRNFLNKNLNCDLESYEEDYLKDCLNIAKTYNLYNFYYLSLYKEVKKYFENIEILQYTEIKEESLLIIINYLKQQHKILNLEFYLKTKEENLSVLEFVQIEQKEQIEQNTKQDVTENYIEYIL